MYNVVHVVRKRNKKNKKRNLNINVLAIHTCSVNILISMRNRELAG